jgi:hypothetical protein
MLDFMTVSTRNTKQGVEIYPKFKMQESNDLMIRGGDFYAIWDNERGLWSTKESDVVRLVDAEMERFRDEHELSLNARIMYMWDADSGSIDKWHKYCQKQCRDKFEMLDENLLFSNSPVNKEDYASKRLSYPLEAGDISAYNKLISTLYSEEERHKIEWAVGAIVSGDSKHIQKFMVMYGAAGTGKSTILNIIQQLFEGYYSVFDAKALGSSSNSFALEAFKTNPLVAIQHDGDLSKIEDNTRLNSLVSHELMTVNEKFKSTYTSRFKCFLFMGTNKPVKITDGRSGLLRRLIDVTPSGNKLSKSEYNRIIKQVSFELGAIAHHCQEVYLKNPGYYDDYIPTMMMGATNDFYNFIMDAYHVFKKEDGTTLKAAWEMYKNYCEEAKVSYPLSQRNFKEELKNYFWDFDERFNFEDGTRVRSYFSGFKTDIFLDDKPKKDKEETPLKLIEFNSTESIFDKEYADCLAQYATTDETPTKKWDDVTTTLSMIDTSKLHYVKVPEEHSHVVVDFDIPDENGNKCLKKNLEAASKWPATYAELSKSGEGIHLHYIYSGDTSLLNRVYDDHIEIKVFTGKSSLRRRLTKCNNLPIATISSGLPMKGEKKMVDFEGIKNEKMLRTMIERNLNKEYHSATKPSIDYINFLLNDAYEKGIGYDVTDLRNRVVAFAASSTNQADYCIKLVNKMKFKSEEVSSGTAGGEETPIVFYDVEVFPNLFLVNWKIAGEENPVIRMINPTPTEIEELLRYRLVGFNCRRYDNHILYARLMGYTNEQLYNLSQKIVSTEKGKSNNGLFGEAYNISYTDVYDFSAKKQSLKKWEIELGIHHQELGLPWDQPVPEEKWVEVASYCDNDVIATEAVFNHLKADFTARQILADLAGGMVNDTTNSLTTKFIFGNNRKPQSKFNYRDLSKPVFDMDDEAIEFLTEIAPEMMTQRHGEAGSLLPYFPGYKYENGVSTYRGEELGEGGKVYAEPGMYGNVALLDITSMHPHSTMLEVLFGVEFTRRFYEIVYGRVHIKHEAWDEVNKMLDGKLTPYIQKVINGEMSTNDLANALKIAINSVYGLTSANFENPFRDVRNKDNIVAKRGALFMTDLKYEVQKRGFTVAHIKTDSIKIPDATPEIIQFVMDFGKRYGYNFEHEATYDRMCLVNDAVYIAKYKDGKHAGEWTATGTQFAVPYVFKTLFSKEPIEFEDMCETKSVKTALYLDMNEELPDVSDHEKELSKTEDKYKKGQLSDITFENTCAELNKLIETGHDYQFIGKVGSFCPIKPDCGGGTLVAERNGKYNAATGTKGYRWLEAEMVKELGKECDIDRSYYDNLVTDAVHSIAAYGDFEWFVSDDPYVKPFATEPKPDFINPPVEEDEVELPWN